MTLFKILSLLVVSMATVWACPASEKAALKTDVMRSVGKATAPIAIRHKLKGRVAVGKPLQVELNFEAADMQQLSVEINTPDELTPVRQHLQQKLMPGQAITLDLMPKQQGRFYLDVFVKNADGSGVPRVLSIPVQVGYKVQKASRATTAANGELLIRMPAE